VGVVVLINSEFLGRGDDELGRKLMGSFLRKIWAREPKPDRIVFYNSGVKLLAEGSGVLDAATGLIGAGVDLIACGTCVSHFKLDGKVAAGRVSNMDEIAGILVDSERVVTA